MANCKTIPESTLNGTPREGIAELIRNHYKTIGDDALAEGAEVGLGSYDELLFALCSLVGGPGIEGDLFCPKAHELARKAIANAVPQ